MPAALNWISRGKPAAYGQEIVKRRFRRTQAHTPLQHKTVLDFGCGNGAQTLQFVNSGCKIVAVDIDHSDVRALRDHLNGDGRRAVMPVLYDGAHLPLADGSIDLVVSFDVLEHTGDETAALREMHRVLKSDGEIILSVPNKGWIFETHGARLPLLRWNRVPFFSWLPHGIHHRFAKARIYRKRDIVRLVREHQFEILHAEYITAPLDVLKRGFLKRMARSLFFGHDTTSITFFATGIFVHGRKLHL
jgi:ubiquinone/menaquinone biosynthesis C-methylase UbiE